MSQQSSSGAVLVTTTERPAGYEVKQALGQAGPPAAVLRFKVQLGSSYFDQRELCRDKKAIDQDKEQCNK